MRSSTRSVTPMIDTYWRLFVVPLQTVKPFSENNASALYTPLYYVYFNVFHRFDRMIGVSPIKPVRRPTLSFLLTLIIHRAYDERTRKGKYWTTRQKWQKLQHCSAANLYVNPSPFEGLKNFSFVEVVEIIFQMHA